MNFSESFLKLSPALKVLDWFTPTNHFDLDAKDLDIDSSGATLIPGTNLVLGGGKEGVLYVLDKRRLGHLGNENALQHFQVSGSHLHSFVYWKSDTKGSMLYVWGQRDRARVYGLKGDRLIETPVMMRPEVNQGHPGAMLSLSANGGKNGILWTAIHATGDSWHESRPGILHAYDADDIEHELWNSLEDAGRDDCNNYSKMAPPTVANGKVYLASFGTQNVGTGQFCVYGLLPDGAVPSAPEGLRADVRDGVVSLLWALVPGARTYNVKIQDGSNQTPELLASGLVSAEFTGITPYAGTSVYVVTAVNSNGESVASKPVTVDLRRAAAVERMHAGMH